MEKGSRVYQVAIVLGGGPPDPEKLVAKSYVNRSSYYLYLDIYF